MIKINENSYPTTVKEMNLKQWVEVSDAIRVFEKDPLTQLEAILKAIGVPQKEIEEIELSFSKVLYDALNGEVESLELVDTIGKYTLDLSQPLNIKTSKMIDKLPEIGNNSIALIAFFYRDRNLTNNEHFDKAHIKHKVKELGILPADLFVVAVGKIMEYLTNETKLIVDETKELVSESN